MYLYHDDKTLQTYEDTCKKMMEALRASPDRHKAQEYLYDRGIEREIANKFCIGWCPESSVFSQQMSHLEPLRGRAVFPIRDEYGGITSFSGRLLDKDAKFMKWWNEPSYPKAFFLYGLDLAIDPIIKNKFVIITEGQMDVITCHRFGLTNAVGLTGSNLTSAHMSKLMRFTTNFVLLLDGDKAGRKSAYDIKSMVEWYSKGNPSQQLKCYDVNLNINGKEYDPDEYINAFGADYIINEICRLKETDNGRS
jgi:DNA primase catalytic core